MQLRTDTVAWPPVLLRVRHLLRQDRVLTAAGLVGSITLLVRGASVLRELLVARQFGVGDAFDAFVMAYLLPSFAVTVIAGSMTAALVPTYINVRERYGQGRADALVGQALVVVTGFLSIVGIAVGLLAQVVLGGLASGFSHDKILMTERLTYVLLPIVVLSGISAVLSGVLNAGERFAIAAATPIATPLVVAGFLLSFGRSWGIYSVAIGWVAGGAIEVGILVIALRRRGVSVRPRRPALGKDLRLVSGQYLPMVLGTTLMSSTLLVDQSMASTLGSGSVSALAYGSRLVTLVAGLGAIGIGTTTMPHFSKLVAHEEWEELRRTLRRYIKFIFLATVPIAIVIGALSHPIVEILLQRGAFSARDAERVAGVQFYFAFQIPFYIAGILVVRLISSLRANALLMWGCILNAILNATLNWLLMKWFGVGGIALSTSLVYITAFFFLLTLANRRIATLSGLTRIPLAPSEQLA